MVETVIRDEKVEDMRIELLKVIHIVEICVRCLW